MVRLIAFIVFVALLVAGGVWLAERPGSVSLLWLGWRIDTSVPMLLLVLAAVAGGLYGLLRLLRLILGVPAIFARVRRERRLHKGFAALAEGYAALVAEDAPRARKKAAEAARILEDKAPAQVLQARVGLLAGSPAAAAEEARQANQALLATPATAVAGLRGLMEAAQAAGSLDDAAHYAEQALARAPKAGWAARAVLAAQVRDGRWTEAATTLEVAARNGALSATEAGRLGAAVHLACLDQALARGEAYEAVRAGKKALDLAPGMLAAVARQARALAAEGNARKAAGLIEGAWKATPHPALATAYMALFSGEDALKRVSRAETLAETNPEHTESRLLVAEAALAARLWGQARGRLKPLVDGPLPADRRAAVLMAAIEEGEHAGSDGATAAVRWLRAALAVPAPVAWHCEACAAPAEVWTPHCPACGGFATLAPGAAANGGGGLPVPAVVPVPVPASVSAAA